MNSTNHQSILSSSPEDLPPPKYHYHRIKEIYNDPLVKKLNRNNLPTFNFYGKYLDHKSDSLILEDFSLDCICRIKLNSETVNYFKKYFYPWFLFRIHRAECTSKDTNYINNYNRSKTLYFNLNNAEAINWIVCFSMIEKENRLFKIHKSISPTIEPQDDSIRDHIREIWFKRLNNVRVSDLKQLKNNGDSKTSFIAQIIGIQIVTNYTCVLRVWDGSKPDFDVKYPANIDNFDLKAIINRDLDRVSNGRQCYVYLNGLAFVEQLRLIRPGQFVLFLNAKIYLAQKNNLPTFRIELCDKDVQECLKPFCKSFDESSSLGKMLQTKLEPYTSTLNNSVNNVADSQISLPTNSFDSNLSRNQITTINKFNEIVRDNVNYQVFCRIVDVFPLDYCAFDLVNLKCMNCKLEDTTKNLFGVDLESLRSSAWQFRMMYGDSKRVNCPLCFQETAFFEFCIILLLEDRESDRCLAIINGEEARQLFKLSALEILSDEYKECRFLNYLGELKVIFNDLNSTVKRSIVMKKDNGIYKIKAINHRRDLIS